MSVESTAKELAAALQGKQSPTAYDTSATVTRVEGDTLWVHIPGGVDETPVKRTVGASAGDEIQIRVGGGRAWAVGNASAPPTDDTTANYAVDLAGEAVDSANIAYNAAVSAQSSAASALESAETAASAAEQAIEDAATADAKAVAASTAAANAQTSANNAATAASNAQTSANNAATAASNAQTSANSAITSANTALTQLSTIEDVVGTLNWISEHGTYVATTDTEVVSGKLYFTRTGSGTDADPYEYSVVTSPASDPSAAGYFELDSVDEAVSNYVASHLALTDDGLYVINDQNGWRVLIKSDGVYIVDDSGTVVAQYKDTVTIGKTGQSYMQLDYHSLRLIDREGSTYFYISDFRNEDGEAVIEDRFLGTGRQTRFSFTALCNEVVSVTVNDVQLSSEDYTYTVTSVTLVNAPADSESVIVVYKTTDKDTKAYSFGIRGQGNLGKYSCVEGLGCIATAEGSHAEGYYTDATGSYAHAEGYGSNSTSDSSHAEGSHTIASGLSAHSEGTETQASGYYSHAEGWHTTASSYSSHAEGRQTIASGEYAHAEGDNTIASGNGSHAEGLYTISVGRYQHVFGKYNVADRSNSYVEIVGKGSADALRSNARTLDWDGNETLAGWLKINGSDKVVPETRTINGYDLSSDITLDASDVEAVPETRTINSKALSADIVLDASDVGAVDLQDGIIYRSTLTASDDLDNITQPGFYYIDTAQPANMPAGLNYCTLLVWNATGTTRTCQILYAGDKMQTEYRRRVYGGTWRAWELRPTRDEVDTLAYDSGWQTLTLNSAFSLYTSDNPVMYRKVGKTVEVRGVIKPTSEIAAGGDATIGTLPSGYRPDITRRWVCHGSSQNMWLLTIYASGVLNFARYGGTSTAAAGTNVWLPFNAMFFVD